MAEGWSRLQCVSPSHSPEFKLTHVAVSRAYFHAKAQRTVLVKLLAEDCSGKDDGKVGLLKKSMYGTRDNWDYELERSSRNRFHNKKRKTSGLTHGDDFARSTQRFFDLDALHLLELF